MHCEICNKTPSETPIFRSGERGPLKDPRFRCEEDMSIDSLPTMITGQVQNVTTNIREQQ